MKKIKLNLLGRVIIAIALGVAVGTVASEWMVRVTATFCTIFSEFLGFVIPLIIVGFVTPAIAGIGRGAGRIVAVTVVIAYLSSVLAGLISFGTGAWLFPGLVQVSAPAATAAAGAQASASAASAGPYFNIEIPAMLNVMTALVLSFVLGIGITVTGADRLRRGFDEFREIVVWAIRAVVIPLLPPYIFGTFLQMTYGGEVMGMMSTFVSIIGVIFGLHIFVLLLQYAVAGAVAGRNPLRLLATMLPAYFTALGTSSSAATIPVTLRQTRLNGVDDEVAGFVVPLCANIHMSGSVLKITACALALMIMQSMPYDLGMFVGFILLLCVTAVAAPGAPGGAIMAALGVLQSVLGFSEAQCAMMISLYVAMDSFGTACNVTGDGAIAVVINKFFGHHAAAAGTDK